tara:strand:+ start:220 stop:492 length:273 start_codon:yes stop_codon:yes gene_type:complete
VEESCPQVAAVQREIKPARYIRSERSKHFAKMPPAPADAKRIDPFDCSNSESRVSSWRSHKQAALEIGKIIYGQNDEKPKHLQSGNYFSK